jgi:hypothetical protein
VPADYEYKHRTRRVVFYQSKDDRVDVSVWVSFLYNIDSGPRPAHWVLTVGDWRIGDFLDAHESIYATVQLYQSLNDALRRLVKEDL